MHDNSTTQRNTTQLVHTTHSRLQDNAMQCNITGRHNKQQIETQRNATGTTTQHTANRNTTQHNTTQHNWHNMTKLQTDMK